MHTKIDFFLIFSAKLLVYFHHCMDVTIYLAISKKKKPLYKVNTIVVNTENVLIYIHLHFCHSFCAR